MKDSIEKCEKLVRYIKKYSNIDLFQISRTLNFKEKYDNLQGFLNICIPWIAMCFMKTHSSLRICKLRTYTIRF